MPSHYLHLCLSPSYTQRWPGSDLGWVCRLVPCAPPGPPRRARCGSAGGECGWAFLGEGGAPPGRRVSRSGLRRTNGAEGNQAGTGPTLRGCRGQDEKSWRGQDTQDLLPNQAQEQKSKDNTKQTKSPTNAQDPKARMPFLIDFVWTERSERWGVRGHRCRARRGPRTWRRGLRAPILGGIGILQEEPRNLNTAAQNALYLLRATFC